jgi:hypothetical protein
MSDSASPTAASSAPNDSVGERLRRLQQLGVHRGRAGLARSRAPQASDARVLETAPSPEELKQDLEPSAEARPVEQIVGGAVVVTPFGPCVVKEIVYPLATMRGGVTMAATLHTSGQAVASCARNRQMASFSMRHAAFIDTETTGLAGGAGTFAFMVGIGTFEPAGPDTAYVVRQVFMRHPGEERALLHVTESILARCGGLVSFNGRAFDQPLLATRFAMHRQPSPLEGMAHLDLLPAARQRWRLRLPSCAMGVLEKEILGFQRSQEDVPGWLIPAIYQDYARTGDGAPVARVFYHNQEDIANMAPLAAILCAPFETRGNVLPNLDLHPVDYVSLGRCFEELQEPKLGEQAYRLALATALPDDVRATALERLGYLLKRQERRAEALAIWQDWITSIPEFNPLPYVELAKHHEWQGADLPAARKWTLWALHQARQMPAGLARDETLADLEHRLSRIEAKLPPAHPLPPVK